MKFAIYSRKSKFTGRGESVENQIDACRTHIMNKYRDAKEIDIFIYEDEGYSGKNTNRPQFQQMMAEEEREPFDLIVVYRLDRISRNMADFDRLMETLTNKGTSFYS
ncbi:MAG: recombinase family protein, partial [Ruminiclostridium sp.]|nr:recombinase family protein [Ruminiclostridium sp.]